MGRGPGSTKAQEVTPEKKRGRTKGVIPFLGRQSLGRKTKGGTRRRIWRKAQTIKKREPRAGNHAHHPEK